MIFVTRDHSSTEHALFCLWEQYIEGGVDRVNGWPWALATEQLSETGIRIQAWRQQGSRLCWQGNGRRGAVQCEHLMLNAVALNVWERGVIWESVSSKLSCCLEKKNVCDTDLEPGLAVNSRTDATCSVWLCVEFMARYLHSIAIY